MSAKYRCTGSKNNLNITRWTFDPRIQRRRSYLQMALVNMYIVAATTKMWYNTANKTKETKVNSSIIPSARSLEQEDKDLMRKYSITTSIARFLNLAN